jgi:hypothetical protein
MSKSVDQRPKVEGQRIKAEGRKGHKEKEEEEKKTEGFPRPESDLFVEKIYVWSEVSPSRRLILNFHLLVRV